MFGKVADQSERRIIKLASAGFLVLDSPGDVARFRDAVPRSPTLGTGSRPTWRPRWRLLPVEQAAYLDRYAQPDEGLTDRSDSWWPAPYWDIDTGFATLLMSLTATDAGLAGCFFGVPIDRIEAFRSALAVPTQFTRSERSRSAMTTSRPARSARCAFACAPCENH
jgi:hypothetical protein